MIWRRVSIGGFRDIVENPESVGIGAAASDSATEPGGLAFVKVYYSHPTTQAFSPEIV